jgi:OOP family OmpA-OmpF porin
MLFQKNYLRESMMKKLLALALIAACAAPAMAANDFYIGADLGSSRVTDDGLKFTGTSYALFAGYNFTQAFAVEAGYRSLGSDTLKVGAANVDLSAYSVQLSMIGSLALSKEFSMFARLGVNSIHSEAKFAGSKISDSETKALLGLGARYAISPQFGLRAEYQKQASNASSLSAGVDFSF